MNIILDDIPRFIKTYLKRFNDLINKKQNLVIGTYITGLIEEINKKNIQNLDNHRLNSNYNQLRNSICKWKYNDDAINIRRIDIFQRQQQTRSRTDGVVVLDDTGNRKSGEKTFGSRRQYLGCIGKVDTGQVVVTTHYADSTKNYPLFFSEYAPKDWVEDNPKALDCNGKPLVFKTKGELALEQLTEIVKLDKLLFRYILFDGWYFQNSRFIKGIQDEHFYICGCYRNQRVYYKRKEDVTKNEYTLGVVIGDLEEKDFEKLELIRPTGEKLIQYVYNFKLKFKQYGWHRVCVCKYKASDNISEARIIVTNDLEVSAKELLETYLLRDRVEKFYQTVKEHLGADEYQVRKANGIKRHWLLVYLAFSMIQFYYYTGGISYWTNKIPKTFGEALRVFQLVLLYLFCKYIISNPDGLNDFLFRNLGKIPT